MEEYDVIKKDDIQLDCIVVTHPDADHMNGIKKLLKDHGQKIHNCNIVLTGAFYRDKKYEEFTTLIDHAKREDIDENRHALTRGLDFHFGKEKGCVLRYTPKDDKLKLHPVSNCQHCSSLKTVIPAYLRRPANLKMMISMKLKMLMSMQPVFSQ